MIKPKNFDYNEFIKTKSLNCESCGAGLRMVKTDDKTCDCEHCGNTNIILEDGKTKVVEKQIPEPKPATKDDSQHKMSKSTMMILGVVMGVAAIGAAYYIYKKIKQDKEQSNGRKRLLLLSK